MEKKSRRTDSNCTLALRSPGTSIAGIVKSCDQERCTLHRIRADCASGRHTVTYPAHNRTRSTGGSLTNTCTLKWLLCTTVGTWPRETLRKKLNPEPPGILLMFGLGTSTIPCVRASKPKKPRVPWREAGCFLAWAPTVCGSAGNCKPSPFSASATLRTH